MFRNKSRVFMTLFAISILAKIHGSDSLQVLNANEKLKVTFYITSLCKDTKKFLLNNFIPAYTENNLRHYLQVNFVPWGKTKRKSNGLVCQFGEPDCMGNKIQSCALHLLGPDQERQIQYMQCEFVNLLSTKGSLQCVEEVGLSPEEVSVCFGSKLGDDLEKANEIQTSSVPLTFVPTIVFNDRFDQGLQDAAFMDFKGTVCHLLSTVNPGVCGSLLTYVLVK